MFCEVCISTLRSTYNGYISSGITRFSVHRMLESLVDIMTGCYITSKAVIPKLWHVYHWWYARALQKGLTIELQLVQVQKTVISFHFITANRHIHIENWEVFHQNKFLLTYCESHLISKRSFTHTEFAQFITCQGILKTNEIC